MNEENSDQLYYVSVVEFVQGSMLETKIEFLSEQEADKLAEEKQLKMPTDSLDEGYWCRVYVVPHAEDVKKEDQWD